jgi:hypothetical protein
MMIGVQLGSLIVREELMLRQFENRMLWYTLRQKREKVTAAWKKF